MNTDEHGWEDRRATMKSMKDMKGKEGKHLISSFFFMLFMSFMVSFLVSSLAFICVYPYDTPAKACFGGKDSSDQRERATANRAVARFGCGPAAPCSSVVPSSCTLHVLRASVVTFPFPNDTGGASAPPYEDRKALT
jgi:hypothetical protein